ncbi:pyrroline-5-carboxylate reductase [Phlyctema vagabunda]|uniref:Pyrroline-5-carboxylate reductase n=1 Tax=Phlyctema vagabunda TaxID=108571 RepID=A0ABR4PB87_9HELO
MCKALTIAVIGWGTMGTAIVSTILESSVDNQGDLGTSPQVSRVLACVRSRKSADRVSSTLSKHVSRVEVLIGENVEEMRRADIVILGCKPIMRRGILQPEGGREAVAGKLVISILAGISTSTLRECIYESAGGYTSECCRIARGMPNMAAKIRESMTVLATPTPALPDEFEFMTFDIAAVLDGCSGSLMILPIDGLLDGCVAEGLKRSDATELVIQAVMGSIKLLTHDHHPSVLREEIASPGGCSIRALLKLESAGVRTTFADAIMEAAYRSRNMSN